MPVKVRLIPLSGMQELGSAVDSEQMFIISNRRDYAKVGFAAARWARESLRQSRLTEGGDVHDLRLEVDFLGGEEPPVATEKKPKRKRGKKAKDGAEA